jgi:glutamate N-acetyltransferase/amino-acid N-acetyltransferase
MLYPGLGRASRYRGIFAPFHRLSGTMAKLKKSPLAPAAFPDIPALAGVRIAGIAAGLKESGNRDLMLAELSPGTTIAGVLTRSACASAPIEWCRAVLGQGSARAIVVNSGNANAFTGKAGTRVVEHTAAATAQLVDCAEDEVFIASTGVIGVPVEADYIARQLPEIHHALAADSWRDAAGAIMTTDTFAKGATRKASIGETEVTLVGIAKGSGMIAPDMATMLAFLFTDAAIPAPILQILLRRANERSFNCITVDGDSSTSDMVLLCATGGAPAQPPIQEPTDPRLRAFARALEELMTDLATQIVRDGEGAQKFVTIEVTGAASSQAARRIGFSIANSPLVKTAIAGGDPNWGRIVMAVGKAGEKADRDRLAIAIGGVQITKNGERHHDYDEEDVARYMAGREIAITVDVGVGRGRATVWTCDLTHGYISINADYRT